MRWIEATDGAGKKVWVNMSEARALIVSGNYTNVQFDKDHYVAVKEAPNQLLAAAGVTP